MQMGLHLEHAEGNQTRERARQTVARVKDRNTLAEFASGVECCEVEHERRGETSLEGTEQHADGDGLAEVAHSSVDSGHGAPTDNVPGDGPLGADPAGEHDAGHDEDGEGDVLDISACLGRLGRWRATYKDGNHQRVAILGKV